MLKTIKINYEAIEMMLFYWESVASREKVVDSYFKEVADREEMNVLYSDEFTKDSVRKVLSAIANRERLNEPTKKESRFWNNNMWMLEDLDNMRNMLKPVKLLNVDELYGEFKENSKFEELRINFIPGHDMDIDFRDGVLTINFFKLMPDFNNPEIIKIEGKDLKDFVLDKAREVL